MDTDNSIAKKLELHGCRSLLLCTDIYEGNAENAHLNYCKNCIKIEKSTLPW